MPWSRVIDPRFGHVVNQGLAGFHVAANADVGSVREHQLDKPDTYITPVGAKSIGELGIASTAAANRKRGASRHRDPRPGPLDHPRQAPVTRAVSGSARPAYHSPIA